MANETGKAKRRLSDPAAGVDIAFGEVKAWRPREGRYRSASADAGPMDRLRDWMLGHPSEIATVGGAAGLPRRKAETIARAIRLSDPVTRLRARGDLTTQEARDRRRQHGAYEVDVYSRDPDRKAWWIDTRYVPAAGSNDQPAQLPRS